MSEATPCNYCSLRDMERRAKARGVTVIVEDSDLFPEGKSARYSDQEKPSAHFMALTDHCVC